jgi:hypothetical protein
VHRQQGSSAGLLHVVTMCGNSEDVDHKAPKQGWEIEADLPSFVFLV